MERPDDRAEKAQADGAGEFGNSISGSFLVSAQGRFAACDQGVGLDFSFEMVTRPTVGALPQGCACNAYAYFLKDILS